MQIIWRELPAILMEIADGGLVGHPRRPHAGNVWKPVALAQIAAGTGGDDIFPGGGATL